MEADQISLEQNKDSKPTSPNEKPAAKEPAESYGTFEELLQRDWPQGTKVRVLPKK